MRDAADAPTRSAGANQPSAITYGIAGLLLVASLALSTNPLYQSSSLTSFDSEKEHNRSPMDDSILPYLPPTSYLLPTLVLPYLFLTQLSCHFECASRAIGPYLLGLT